MWPRCRPSRVILHHPAITPLASQSTLALPLPPVQSCSQSCSSGPRCPQTPHMLGMPGPAKRQAFLRVSPLSSSSELLNRMLLYHVFIAPPFPSRWRPPPCAALRCSQANDLPRANRVVGAGAGHDGLVGGDGHRQHLVRVGRLAQRVGLDGVEAGARADAPQLDGLVCGPRRIENKRQGGTGRPRRCTLCRTTAAPSALSLPGLARDPTPSNPQPSPSPPLKNVSPSGAVHTQCTLPWCPVKVCSTSPVSTSQHCGFAHTHVHT